MPFYFWCFIMKNFFEVKNLCYAHYKQPLCLKDVCFSLKENDRLLVLGLEEMGKTTLINAISGFDNKYFGNVYFQNIDIKNILDADKGFSVIHEVPIMVKGSIDKNLDFACSVLGISKTIEEKQELLDKFCIGADLKTNVKKLDYNQMLKLNFARVYIKQPRILFVDNIFKNIRQEDFNEVYEKFRLVSDKRTVVLTCDNTEVLNHPELVNWFNPTKILYINNANFYLYDSIESFMFDKIDLNVFCFTDEYKCIEGACFLQNDSYIFVDHTGIEVKLDKSFNSKLDAMKIDEIEGVDTALVFKKTENIDLSKNNDVNEALKKGKLNLYFKLDGSRII